MKKNILKMLTIYFVFITKVFANGKPDVVCNGLPGCKSEDIGASQDVIQDIDYDFFGYLGNIIREAITYVQVLAVLALMVSGIMYLMSAGEDEKVKKAKNAIIWSLVGVLLSTGAWALINIVNKFNIT